MKEIHSSEPQPNLAEHRLRISSLATGTGLLVGAIGVNFLADRAIESMPQDLAVEIIRNAVRLGIFCGVVKLGAPLLQRTISQK